VGERKYLGADAMSFHDAMHPDDVPDWHKGEYVPDDEPDTDEGDDDEDE
jgi:hypothetical protein